MLKSSLRAIGLLLAGFSTAAAYSPQDIADLAAHLRGVRGQRWFTPDEYKNLRAEYLAWIDARVKAGQDIDSMNQDLKDTGLLPDWSSGVEEIDKSHAGYLEKIGKRRVQGAKDVFVVEAGIYKGVGCSIDITAVVYEQGSLTKLAEINAEPNEPDNRYHLSGIDIGNKDASGRRLAASGWVVSNCTSTWNGKLIRIDRFKPSSMENILTRDLYAHDRDTGENVAAQVQQDIVTFQYDGGVGDSLLLALPAVAKYRIVEGRAIRQVPIALTRAGFIYEWLTMKDADPASWSEPPSIEMRASIAGAISKHLFDWANVSRCNGSPPVWEVAVDISDIEKSYVFRIAGERAAELRMLGIGDNLTKPVSRKTSAKVWRA